MEHYDQPPIPEVEDFITGHDMQMQIGGLAIGELVKKPEEV